DGVEPLLKKLGFHVAVKERLVTAIRESGWALHAADVQPITQHRLLVATYRSVKDASLLITWNVHLPSPARAKEKKIQEAVRDLVAHASAHREPLGLDAFEVVGGDFNLPPYNDQIMLSQRDYLRAGRS